MRNIHSSAPHLLGISCSPRSSAPDTILGETSTPHPPLIPSRWRGHFSHLRHVEFKPRVNDRGTMGWPLAVRAITAG